MIRLTSLRIASIFAALLAAAGWTAGFDGGAPSFSVGPPGVTELRERATKLANAEAVLAWIEGLNACRVPRGRHMHQLCGEMRVELPLIKESLRTLRLEIAATSAATPDAGTREWIGVEAERNELVQGLLDRTSRRLELLQGALLASH